MKGKVLEWMVPTSIGVILVLLIVGSFASPILIYLTLLVLGMLALFDIIRINDIKSFIDSAKNPIPEEAAPSVETQQPTPEEIKQQKLEETLVKYVIDNLNKGYKIEAIREVMVKKYEPEFVDWIISHIQTAPPLPEEPILPEPEKPNEQKVEIINPEHFKKRGRKPKV